VLQCGGVRKLGYQVSVSGSVISACFDHQSRRRGSDASERLKDPVHGRLIRLFLWCFEDMEQNPLAASQVLGEKCLHPPAGDGFKKLVLVGKFHGFRWLDGSEARRQMPPEPFTLHRHYLDSKEANTLASLARRC